MQRIVYPTVIWDLDGTLCECGIYYDKALRAFTTFQHQRTGLPEPMIRAVIDQLDLAALHLPKGWARERFPRSFYAASVALDVLRQETIWENVAIDHGAAQQSWAIGDAVFEAPYELYDGVKETLQTYSDGGWQVALWTKGDPLVQEGKLKKHDLNPLFDAVFVVPKKTPELLQWIIEQCRCDLERTWVIGDSLKDDIGPAVQLGLGTVRVDVGTHTWSDNDAAHRPLDTVDAPSKVPLVIPTYAGARGAVVKFHQPRKAAAA